MTKRGFTLVELLIVVAILAIVGTLILTILTRSFRGGNKSQIVSSIKQNGQSVLEIIDKTIRNADNVVCVSSLTDPGPTIVIVKDGIFTRYRFFAATNMANGYIAQDAPIQPASGAQADIKVFIDNVCTDPQQGANVLTDTNPQTGVSVASVVGNLPYIVRDIKPGFKDAVTIQFDLKPGISAPLATAGQIDPVTFKTTINLR